VQPITVSFVIVAYSFLVNNPVYGYIFLTVVAIEVWRRYLRTAKKSTVATEYDGQYDILNAAGHSPAVPSTPSQIPVEATILENGVCGILGDQHDDSRLNQHDCQSPAQPITDTSSPVQIVPIDALTLEQELGKDAQQCSTVGNGSQSSPTAEKYADATVHSQGSCDNGSGASVRVEKLIGQELADFRASELRRPSGLERAASRKHAVVLVQRDTPAVREEDDSTAGEGLGRTEEKEPQIRLPNNTIAVDLREESVVQRIESRKKAVVLTSESGGQGTWCDAEEEEEGGGEEECTPPCIIDSDCDADIDISDDKRKASVIDRIENRKLAVVLLNPNRPNSTQCEVSESGYSGKGAVMSRGVEVVTGAEERSLMGRTPSGGYSERADEVRQIKAVRMQRMQHSEAVSDERGNTYSNVDPSPDIDFRVKTVRPRDAPRYSIISDSESSAEDDDTKCGKKMVAVALDATSSTTRREIMMRRNDAADNGIVVRLDMSSLYELSSSSDGDD
jgi:hypothetical protein